MSRARIFLCTMLGIVAESLTRCKQAPVRRILIPVVLAVLILAAQGGAHASGPQPQHRCDDYDPTIAWLEAPYEHFSICYTAAYASDVSWVASWLSYAHWHLSQKYGIVELRTARYWPKGPPGGGSAGYYGGDHSARMHVSVMLLPASDAWANAQPGGSTTRFMLGAGVYEGVDYGPSEGATRYAYIPYVTPSSPDWGDAESSVYGVLQSPFCQHHIKNFMHEYTHAVQETIWSGEPEGRKTQWSNPVPWWVSEGLAEYEGGANTTDYHRTDGYVNLIQHVVEAIPHRIFCCETLTGDATITTTDAYFGGRLILHWLAAALGEDVHTRLVRHQHDTFTAALTAELAAAGMAVEQAWAALRAWAQEEYARLVDPPPL